MQCNFERIFLILSSLPLFILAYTADAQSQRLISEVPIEIIVAPDGASELITRQIPYTSLEELREAAPSHIPVRFLKGDGSSTTGLIISNLSNKPTDPAMLYPGIVLLMPDNTWRIESVAFSFGCGLLHPGERVLVPGSENASLRIALDANGIHQSAWEPLSDARSPIVDFVYDHTGSPLNAIEQDVEEAIQRVVDRYNDLMNLSNYRASFSIVWDNTLPGSILMRALVVDRQTKPWNVIYNDLQSMMLGDDANATEVAVYDWLPNGTSVPHIGDTGSGTTTNITLSHPLLNNWFGIVQDDPMIILVNPNTLWFFDSSSATDESIATSFDFEGSLAHEIGHHLGFISSSPITGSPSNMTTLDVFRFAIASGPTISAAEMQSAAREMRSGLEALAACGLNDGSRLYAMSSDGDHWKDSAPGIDPVGLMRVSAGSGSMLLNNSSFQTADVRAFDILGFEIDQDATLGGPGVLVPV